MTTTRSPGATPRRRSAFANRLAARRWSTLVSSRPSKTSETYSPCVLTLSSPSVARFTTCPSETASTWSAKCITVGETPSPPGGAERPSGQPEPEGLGETLRPLDQPRSAHVRERLPRHRELAGGGGDVTQARQHLAEDEAGPGQLSGGSARAEGVDGVTRRALGVVGLAEGVGQARLRALDVPLPDRPAGARRRCLRRREQLTRASGVALQETGLGEQRDEPAADLAIAIP